MNAEASAIAPDVGAALVRAAPAGARDEDIAGGPRDPLVLRDGRVVEVRPLEREDRAALAAAVARLSDETRYLRFAAAKPRLTARDLDVLTDLDHHGREALLAIDPATRLGVAVVRYAALPDEPGVVEIAATVDDQWHGLGIGTALVERLVARARAEGHVALRANVLPENARSLAMLRRAGFRVRASGGGLLELELPLGIRVSEPPRKSSAELRLAGEAIEAPAVPADP